MGINGYACSRMVGWLVGDGDFTNTHCKVMVKGRYFPQNFGPRVERFIAHSCSGDGEAFVIPAEGVCYGKKIPQVFKRIPQEFVK